MIDAIRLEPGSTPRLTERDPRNDLGLGSRDAAKQVRGDLGKRLSKLQGRLFAEGERSVLLVLQGLDASGKDGVIREVFEGVNPTGVHVTSFRAPTDLDVRERYDEYVVAWKERGLARGVDRMGRRVMSSPPTGTRSRARLSRPCSSTPSSVSTRSFPIRSPASRAW